MVGRVHEPIELWLLVMNEMPDVVLSVKEKKYSQPIDDHLIQCRSSIWQFWCR